MRSSGYDRHVEDWYVEPAWAVDALLEVEEKFSGTVIDPCCGGGNIPSRLKIAGCDVVSSDFVDRNGSADLIGSFEEILSEIPHETVISNPPYGLAREFVDCALENTTDRVCVLLRLAFLEGIKRRDWFRTVPLARVWVSSRRMSMPPGGSDVRASGGAIAYAWFVFEHGHIGAPVIGFLPDVATKAEGDGSHGAVGRNMEGSSAGA